MERSDQGRRRARRGAMLQYLGDKIWRQAARREAGPRREARGRPGCRRRERRDAGEGTKHAGDVMNMSPERGFAGVRGRRRGHACAPRATDRRSPRFRPPRSAAIAPAPMTGAAICASRAMQNSSLARRRLSIGICDSNSLFVNHFGRRSSILTVSRHNSKPPTIVR